MFSINGGEKIAAVIKDDKKITKLFISEKRQRIPKDEKMTLNNELDCYCHICDKKFYSKNELKRHKKMSCMKDIRDWSNNGKSRKDYIIASDGKEIRVCQDSDSCELFPVFINSKNDTVRALIIGASGSGKTTFARKFISTFKAFNPEFEDYSIVLISRHQQDVSIDELDQMVRLDIDELVEDIVSGRDDVKPLTLEELSNKIIIFDDVENSSNKQWQKYVENLRNDIFENGRKYNIHTISIIHLYDGKYLRTLINESNNLVLMNQNMSYNNDRIITKYLGLSNKDNTRLKKLLNDCGSCRFMYFNLAFPRNLITSKFAWIL